MISPFSTGRRSFLRASLLAFPTLVLPSGLLLKRPGGSAEVSRSTYAMGTQVSIHAFGENTRHVHAAITKAFERLHYLDSMWSIYKSGSDFSRINASAGERAIPVTQETVSLLQAGVTFSETTGGLFDCTIEPLMRLWGFRNENKTLRHAPSDKNIAAALELVGSQNIYLNPSESMAGLRRTNASIDPGGFAVGYAVDSMVDILRREGIESSLINHSGDIYALGAPPESAGWQIAIPSPTDINEPMQSLSLSNQAISTSGSYNSYVLCDGERYGHIIETLRGTPAMRFSSLSVVADTSLEADVFSTAWFCADPDTIDKKCGRKRAITLDQNLNLVRFPY
jgi:thiamine biosynthesis lipoprotein